MADPYWIPIPEDALAGQYRVGDYLHDEQGTPMKIAGRSTQMLYLCPVAWYEKLWLRLRGS